MDSNKKSSDDTTDDSDIEDDLVSTINYNTITSLAALKDMLQSSGENSEGVDSFFHHYFLSHVNRLPSRNQTHSPYPWVRRLSECREEDEYENDEGKKISEESKKMYDELLVAEKSLHKKKNIIDNSDSNDEEFKKFRKQLEKADNESDELRLKIKESVLKERESRKDSMNNLIEELEDMHTQVNKIVQKVNNTKTPPAKTP